MNCDESIQPLRMLVVLARDSCEEIAISGSGSFEKKGLASASPDERVVLWPGTVQKYLLFRSQSMGKAGTSVLSKDAVVG